MFLRKLILRGYGIFEDATFDLATDVDHPIVLVTGNNGAGKTTLLEALRVAFHGKRAFDTPIGEADYLRLISGRFFNGSKGSNASISLDFDYVDSHTTKHVLLTRSWTRKRQSISESLDVTLDGHQLHVEDANDLLTTIVPPEIARYFFFDAERIRELAEWDVEDESALFSAVEDLLGLGVLEQLRADLLRLSATSGRGRELAQSASAELVSAEHNEKTALAELKAVKSTSRRIRASFERARSEVRRVGALRQDEVIALDAEMGALTAERRSLIDESQRAAADVLPLLCARTLRKKFGAEIQARREIEDRAIASEYLDKNFSELVAAIRSAGAERRLAESAAIAIAAMPKGTLKPVSDVVLPSLSRNDSVWMRRVIEHELPEMARRNATIVERLRAIESRLELLEAKRKSVPINDPTGDAALSEFENRQRDLIEYELLLASKEAALANVRETLAAAQNLLKEQRFERFKAGKLEIRERSIAGVLDALPTLTERLQSSKEVRFEKYLEGALRELWHKTERLVSVEVSFSGRRIALLDAYGEMNKRDLSAGEKQLFAVAFIYALAKLSGRHMPFVIDTPLGRLDTEHRRRFVADFIPNASHQVVLLSTDTEIVGQLYRNVKPLIAHHHELSNFNGRATEPVQVSA